MKKALIAALAIILLYGLSTALSNNSGDGLQGRISKDIGQSHSSDNGMSSSALERIKQQTTQEVSNIQFIARVADAVSSHGERPDPSTLKNCTSSARNHALEDYVKLACHQGWLQKSNYRSFNPDASITRGQAVEIIKNAFNKNTQPINNTNDPLDSTTAAEWLQMATGQPSTK